MKLETITRSHVRYVSQEKFDENFCQKNQCNKHA